MQTWVISIVGIVALSVLVDILLPEGDIAKYIKGVFSIMTICVIVAPLPRIIDNIKESSMSEPTFEEIALDDKLLNTLNRDKLNLIEVNISKLLVSNGASNVRVIIEDDFKDEDIDCMEIYCENMTCENVNKLIKKYLKLNIKEVKIVGTNSG